MLLIAARYYELPQWNNNLKSLGSDTVPVQVRSAAPPVIAKCPCALRESILQLLIARRVFLLFRA